MLVRASAVAEAANLMAELNDANAKLTATSTADILSALDPLLTQEDHHAKQLYRVLKLVKPCHLNGP